MGQEEAPSIEDVAFNLRFKSKEMEREAKRCEKEMAKEKLKVKKQLQKGNLEAAQIFAQNAIRKKNEMINFTRLAARLDGTSSRIKTAAKQKNITGMMGKVTRGLDLTMKNMNVDKVAKVMDVFEKQMEDLDIVSTVQEKAMGSSVAGLQKEDEVNDLLGAVIDEYNVNVSGELSDVLVKGGVIKNDVAAKNDLDELEQMQKKLQQM